MPLLTLAARRAGAMVASNNTLVRAYQATAAAAAITSKINSNVPAVPLDGPEAFRQYVLRAFAGTLNPKQRDPFRRNQSTATPLPADPWKDWTPGPNSALKKPPPAKRVVVVGSGGLSIGQAGEFDYSGMHYDQSSHRYLLLMINHSILVQAPKLSRLLKRKA